MRCDAVALPFVKTFELQLGPAPQSATLAIKKRINYTSSGASDTSDYHSDSVIPIPRGELTRHIREQQVTVRSSDEDVMCLPVVGGEARQPKKSKPRQAPIAYDIAVQPVELYSEPRECVRPPPLRVPDKYITVVSSDEWKSVPKTVTDMTIETECFNDEYMKYMKLGQFRHLKSITLNDYCCSEVSTLAIRNCQYVETVTVGDDCFSPVGVRNASEYQYVLKALKKDLEGGTFYAGNDYYLNSIQIGRQSFLKFSRFSLSRRARRLASSLVLPNLRSLVIGEVSSYDDVNIGSFNFLGVPVLSIEGDAWRADLSRRPPRAGDHRDRLVLLHRGARCLADQYACRPSVM